MATNTIRTHKLIHGTSSKTWHTLFKNGRALQADAARFSTAGAENPAESAEYILQDVDDDELVRLLVAATHMATYQAYSDAVSTTEWSKVVASIQAELINRINCARALADADGSVF